MAEMVGGKWVDTKPAAEEVGKDGQFRRKDSAYRHRIGDAAFPAEAGRYHLWVAWVCPWAGRDFMPAPNTRPPVSNPPNRRRVV